MFVWEERTHKCSPPLRATCLIQCAPETFFNAHTVRRKCSPAGHWCARGDGACSWLAAPTPVREDAVYTRQSNQYNVVQIAVWDRLPTSKALAASTASARCATSSSLPLDQRESHRLDAPRQLALAGPARQRELAARHAW